MQADFAHQAVHEKRGARHVAGVFEEADKEKEQQDLWEKYDDGAHTRDHTIHEQAVQVARRDHSANRVAQPANAALQGDHRDAREREDALEHEHHNGQEDDCAPHLMRQDAVELVAEGLAGGRRFRGDGALDGRHGHIAAFDGHASPVNPGGIET